MSYCRFSPPWEPFGKHKSDVYLIGSLNTLDAWVSVRQRIPISAKYNGITLSGNHGYSFSTNDRQEMLDFLHELRQHGVKVPRYATRRLKSGIKKYGRIY